FSVAGGAGRVGDEPLEGPPHEVDVLVRDASPDPLVEVAGGPAEPAEQLPARLGELDLLDAPVLGSAVAADEPRLLHGAQVVGERRPLDADLLGDVPLRRHGPGAQRQQHEPHGPRPALAGQHLVELAMQELDIVPKRPPYAHLRGLVPQIWSIPPMYVSYRYTCTSI